MLLKYLEVLNNFGFRFSMPINFFGYCGFKNKLRNSLLLFDKFS